jgi:hypothetical protein
MGIEMALVTDVGGLASGVAVVKKGRLVRIKECKKYMSDWRRFSRPKRKKRGLRALEYSGDTLVILYLRRSLRKMRVTFRRRDITAEVKRGINPRTRVRRIHMFRIYETYGQLFNNQTRGTYPISCSADGYMRTNQQWHGEIEPAAAYLTPAEMQFRQQTRRKTLVYVDQRRYHIFREGLGSEGVSF